MDYVKSYKDLKVYIYARKLSYDIYVETKKFPREEKYSLTSQIRRSSRSVGAQIAEAWAKRRYERHFVSKLTDGDAEQQETQHWIVTACDCDYLDEHVAEGWLKRCSAIGKMLNAMIDGSRGFCKKR